MKFPKVLSPNLEDGDRYFKPVDQREFKAGELKLTTNLSDDEIAAKVELPSGEAVRAAMNFPQVRGYLAKHLDDAGATLEATAKAIAEAHHADDVTVTREGDIITLGPNHKIRLDAAELNLKARGELRDAGVNISVFAGMTDEQVAQIAAGQLDPATLIDVGPRINNPAQLK